MGYEVLVTPLQLLTAFCAIVNDGVRVRPHVVHSLLSPEGSVTQEWTPPTSLDRAVRRDVARLMASDLLVSAVEEGGGHRARIGPYRVLGKTGTAKLVPPGRRRYEPGEYQGLFMGAAPVSDPRVAVLVVVRRPDPSIGYYGGTVAAAPAGEILTRTLAYLGVAPDADAKQR
jgi:cell division protein FtsI/penicillin-binding protein 2